MQHGAPIAGQLSMCRLSACRPGRRRVLRERQEHHRAAVWELRDQGQRAAHRFHGFPKGREQDIASLLEARDAVLLDFQSLGNADLRQLTGFSELAQGHLFRHQLRRSRFYSPALRRAQLPDFVIDVDRHGQPLSTTQLTLITWHTIHMISNTH